MRERGDSEEQGEKERDEKGEGKMIMGRMIRGVRRGCVYRYCKVLK